MSTAFLPYGSLYYSPVSPHRARSLLLTCYPTTWNGLHDYSSGKLWLLPQIMFRTFQPWFPHARNWSQLFPLLTQPFCSWPYNWCTCHTICNFLKVIVSNRPLVCSLQENNSLQNSHGYAVMENMKCPGRTTLLIPRKPFMSALEGISSTVAEIWEISFATVTYRKTALLETYNISIS